MPKPTLEELLTKLYLLPPEEERRIRDNWNSLTPFAQDRLLQVLEDSVKKQDAMLRKILEQDPQFASKLKEFLKTQMTKAEVADATANSEILSSIEQQLDA